MIYYDRLIVLCLYATATTEIYTYGHTLSRHDALPILPSCKFLVPTSALQYRATRCRSCRSWSSCRGGAPSSRSADASSSCGPRQIGRAHVLTPVTNAHFVCRLLLEKITTLSKHLNKNIIIQIQSDESVTLTHKQ